MIYVGIDVAKDKHDCYIVDSNGVVKHDNFTISNTRQGFNKLLDIIKKFDDKLQVGLEATGDYHKNLLFFLTDNSVEVVVFNPLAVNRMKSAGTLRKTKTDKNDARYLASLLTGHHKPYSPQEYHITQLKSLTRARFRLVSESQPLKNRFKRLIQLVFPELHDIFPNLYSTSVLSLLESLPSAKHIAECDIRKLASLLTQSSRGMLSRVKAEELKTHAKNSIGCSNSGDCMELTLTVKRIAFYEKQRAVLEDEIESVMKTLDSPITTIPGIGTVLGATILAEIGEISNFATPAKLQAFAGCEPSTYQSGKYVATNTPMVKRGSKYLRRALYLATNAAYLHNPIFREYINKKRGEGKHHYVAMSHGMKKMVRLIHAVLLKDTEYVPSITKMLPQARSAIIAVSA